jgi:putative peptidoglycan lipid II flippase
MVPFKHVGIALATGITAWVNLGLLAYGLKKRGHLDIKLDSVKKTGWIVLSATLMVVCLKGLEHLLGDFLAGGQAGRFASLGVLVVAGAGVYFTVLHMTGVFGLKHVKALFPNGAKKATIPAKEKGK